MKSKNKQNVGRNEILDESSAIDDAVVNTVTKQI